MKTDDFWIPNGDIFVSIIILNYNGGNILLECMKSIHETEGCKYEIILIDNNSNDNSHVICKEKFPDIILIKNDDNIGMSARNIGIKKAKGNFIVLLDSDTVVERNWLIHFINSYKKNNEGLYQPKLLEKERPNIINSAGNMINIFGLAYSRGKGEVDSGQYDNFQRISYTSGACTFSSLNTMKKIGEIDHILFAYHDDVDYGWRASLLGVPSYYEPEVIVYHHGSSTLKWSPKKFFLLERNRWICLLTLYSQKTLAKIFPLLILVEIGMLFFFIKRRMGIIKLKAFFSLIKIHKEIRIRRERMMKSRSVSDKIIIKNFVDDFWLPSATINEDSAKRVDSIMRMLNKQARKIINM
jgi:GT2 family glycosyltransferase